MYEVLSTTIGQRDYVNISVIEIKARTAGREDGSPSARQDLRQTMGNLTRARSSWVSGCGELPSGGIRKSGPEGARAATMVPSGAHAPPTEKAFALQISIGGAARGWNLPEHSRRKERNPPAIGGEKWRIGALDAGYSGKLSVIEVLHEKLAARYKRQA